MFFSIKGHKNVLCTHETTLEFTKDKHLTKRGDCILGVVADFNFSELKQIVEKYDSIRLTISMEGETEVITAKTNKNFNNQNEMVIRTSDFLSERTIAIKADKAAIDVNRNIVEKLKNPKNKAKIEIKGI